ncbi:MAG: hypothetical protein WCG81_01005, partial [Candidatus Angelobacter sp.]
MKTRWITSVLIAGIGLISFSAHGLQTVLSNMAVPTSAQMGTEIKIVSGTLIQVEMNTDVDVRKAHA